MPQGPDDEQPTSPFIPPTESPRAVSPPPLPFPPPFPNTEGGEEEDGSNKEPSLEAQTGAYFIVPQEEQRLYTFPGAGPTSNKRNILHPYTRPLTISDLESVVALENAAFPNPEARATREKFIYRLNKCGELCLGLFCTIVPRPDVSGPATLSTGHAVETSRRDGAISVLIGHVIAAKTNDVVASDKSMELPKDWDSPNATKTDAGHQEAGRTIVLHSVAILPEFQGKGLGRVLVQAYIQQMNGAGIADRLALIAHDHKMGWYERLGFSNQGPSNASFGGGGWYDMTYELKSLEAQATYG